MLHYRYDHGTTQEMPSVSVAKIAISIDKKILSQLDALVKQDKFANRSQAIQIAVEAKLLELSHDRLAKECEKLDIAAEQQMADELFDQDDSTWSKF